MIRHQPGGESEARQDIVTRQCRILIQDILDTVAGAEELEKVCTVMRVPRITGRPLQIFGLTMMRSSIKVTLHRAKDSDKSVFNNFRQ